MHTKLKMGIVGAGTWGENHARIYQAHPFAECVAICDMNADKAASLASRLDIKEYYSDYHAMLKNSNCDAVAIVTPDFAHADIAVAVAEAGRDMIIEKPIATTRADISRMMNAFEKHKNRVMVDLHNRWSPPFHETYQSVVSGDLGEISTVYSRLNDVKWVATDLLPWAAKSSILWFLGTHSLDTMRWIVGSEVKEVYSRKRSGILRDLGIDTIDSYQTSIEFENGVIAQMENAWITPDTNPCVNDIKFNITGSKGMINLDVSNHNLIQKYTDEKATAPDVLVQNKIFGIPKGFAYESIKSFVDCLMSGDAFKVSVTDAVNTSLGILAIMESADKKELVQVDLSY